MAAYRRKSAVLGLTRSLARDWGVDGIRVSSLAPGWIAAERQKSMWLTAESERELMTRQCLKRKLVPDDVARVVLFLAADDSAAMTNQSYIVDGGWVETLLGPRFGDWAHAAGGQPPRGAHAR
ncbi:MAG: SDR family oxidoreductase [Geminicoccaceae bacterium]